MLESRRACVAEPARAAHRSRPHDRRVDQGARARRRGGAPPVGGAGRARLTRPPRPTPRPPASARAAGPTRDNRGVRPRGAAGCPAARAPGGAARDPRARPRAGHGRGRACGRGRPGRAAGAVLDLRPVDRVESSPCRASLASTSRPPSTRRRRPHRRRARRARGRRRGRAPRWSRGRWVARWRRGRLALRSIVARAASRSSKTR